MTCRKSRLRNAAGERQLRGTRSRGATIQPKQSVPQTTPRLFNP